MAGNIRIWPAILPATIMVCRYIWPAILPRPYLSCRPYLQPQLDRSAIINACKSFDLLGNPVQPAKHEQYLNQSAIISKECKLPSSRTTCHPLRGERSTGAGWGRHDEHVASSYSQWHPSPRPLSDGGEAASCTDDDGTCGAPDHGGYDPTTTIIRTIPGDDGTMVLREERYPGGTASYGYRIMRHLSKIQQHSKLLSKISKLERQWQEQLLTEGSSHEGKLEVKELVYDVTPGLLEEILDLALLHREEWSQIALDRPFEEEHSEGELAYAADHFDKSINAYETALHVYNKLWMVMQTTRRTPDDPEEEEIFDDLDEESVAAGQSSVYLHLADMFHQRYLHDGKVPISIDSFSTTYHLLANAEAWCIKSLGLLGVAAFQEHENEHHSYRNDSREAEAERKTIVRLTKETMAFVNVRLGAVMIDMYGAGHVLDMNDPQNTEFQRLINEYPHAGGEERMLRLTLEKLSNGLELYSMLAAKERTVELNVADAYNYMGVVHGYLNQWTEAIESFDKSMALYEELLDVDIKAGLENEAVAQASGMIQTSQSFFEACLSAPGNTEQARVAFQSHLVLRRYYEGRIPLNEPLEDEEENEVDAYHEHYLSDKFDRDGSIAYSWDAVLNDDESTLELYQDNLDDYLKLLNEYAPSDSWHFDAYDGITADAYLQDDKVYEGSMRTAIGSLKLAKNRIWEARGELETAVRLLREGIGEGRDSFEADVEGGEIIEYSVRLELANALLNLAYAQVALKQWKSSFQSFEEAMDLFASELREDESPYFQNDHPSSPTTKNAIGNLGERMAHIIKGLWGDSTSTVWTPDTKSGIDEADADVGGGDDGDKGGTTLSGAEDSYSNSHINLDIYPMLENATDAGVRIM